MTGAQLAVAPSESVTEIVKPVIFSDSGVHVSVTLVTLPPALLIESTDGISSLIVMTVPLVELDELLACDMTAAPRTVTLNECTDVTRKLMRFVAFQRIFTRIRRVADRWARVSDLLLRVRDVCAKCFRVVASRQRARVGHIHKARVICVIVLRSEAGAIRVSIECLVASEQLQHKRRRVRLDLVDENGHEAERRAVVICPGLRVRLVVAEDRLVLQYLPAECERVKRSICVSRRQLSAIAEREVVHRVTIEIAVQASNL